MNESVSQTYQKFLPSHLMKALGSTTYLSLLERYQAGLKLSRDSVADYFRQKGEARYTDPIQNIAFWNQSEEAASEQVKLAELHQMWILCALDPKYPVLLKAAGKDSVGGVIFLKGALPPQAWAPLSRGDLQRQTESWEKLGVPRCELCFPTTARRFSRSRLRNRAISRTAI